MTKIDAFSPCQICDILTKTLTSYVMNMTVLMKSFLSLIIVHSLYTKFYIIKVYQKCYYNENVYFIYNDLPDFTFCYFR